MIGSVLIVLLAFQRVATLGSIESQESARDLISSPPGDGLGLSVDDVQAIFRVLAFIAAASGTAAAILGWQVLQRSRSARLALSVLAPVLVVSGFRSAGFSTALVAAAVVMLWVQPTRDWFDGREAPARPTPPVPAPHAQRDGTSPPVPQQPSAWGLAPPGAPTGPIAPPWPPPAHPAAGAGQPRGGRPTQVATGCTVAMVGSGITLAFSLLGLASFTLSRSAVIEAVEQSDSSSFDGYSATSIVEAATWVCAVMLVWSLIAIGLAVATMARSNVARFALVVSSVVAAFVCLLGVLTAIFIPVMVVTVVQLLRPEAGAWFAARR